MKAAIVGAGIVGRLLAWQLHKIGCQITIYDPAKVGNCSMTAAGMLTPVTELARNPLLIYELGILGIEQYWPVFLNQLPSGNYLKQQGSIVLAHQRDQADLHLFIKQIEHKLAKQEAWHSLDSEHLQKLEPEITKFSKGYYFPDEGQIDAQALMLTLENELIDVDWQYEMVSEVTAHRVIVGGHEDHFDLVIDTRGLGAKDVYKDLRAIRGELIWLHAPGVNITRPIRMLHPRYSLYLVPRDNQHYIIGASEIEVEDYSPISVRTNLELLTAVYSIHPTLAEARIINSATHCRPTLANHLPRIYYSDGYISVNGLYRHGYLLVATLVYEICQWINDGISAVKFSQLWEEVDDYRLCG